MKNYVLLLLTFFFCIAMKAQDTSNAKVITYAPFATSTLDVKKDVKIEKNDIKWNISLLSRGVFMFNYERVLSEHISLEAGLGSTYRDYGFEIYNDAIAINSTIPLTNNTTGTVKPGFAIEFAPRIYPRDGYMEGFYFGPIFRYRKYNYSVNNLVIYNDSTNMDQTFRGSSNIGHSSGEYGFIIGYQTDQSYWYDISWDYYFGVSLRTNTYKDASYNGSILRLVDKSTTIPAILFGLKIGLFQF